MREGDGNARVSVVLQGASVQLEKGEGARVSVTTSSLTARSKLVRLCISNFFTLADIHSAWKLKYQLSSNAVVK